MDSRYMSSSYIAPREAFPAQGAVVGQDSRICVDMYLSGN